MPIKTAWARALVGLAIVWLGGLVLLRAAEAKAPLAAPTQAIHLPAIQRNHGPAQATPTPAATATPTRTPAPTQTPAVLIYGWVALAGQPAAGVTIELGLYEMENYIGALDQASTDQDGLYSFTVDAGLLGPGQSLGVRYENEAEAEGQLLYWRGYPFAPAAGATTHPGGDFDIADIVLVTPDTSDPLPLPIAFAWLPRDPAWAPDDVYQLALAWRVGDDTIAAFTSEDLLDDHYLLGSLPEGFAYGQPMEWWVAVWGAYGEGRSLSTNWAALAAP